MCESFRVFSFFSFPVVCALVASFYFILALPFFIVMFVSVKVRMDDNSVEQLVLASLDGKRRRVAIALVFVCEMFYATDC